MRYDDIMKYKVFHKYLHDCIEDVYKKIDQHKEELSSQSNKGKILYLKHKFGLIDIELVVHGGFSNYEALKRAFNSQVKYLYVDKLREAFTKEQEKIKQSLKEKQELEKLIGYSEEAKESTNKRNSL